MNKIKLIIKGVMVWTTILSALLFIMGIDSIYDSGYFFQTFIAVMIMCYTCFKLVSKEEYKKITFCDILNQHG